jgi:hypothetical protein
MTTPLMEQLRRMAETEADPYRSLMLLGLAELSAQLYEQREWVKQLQSDSEKVHERMDGRTEKLWKTVYGNGEEGLTNRMKNTERNWRTLMYFVTPVFGTISVGLLAFVWALLSGRIVITHIP